jgi:predicted alpha/beta hydrolase
MLDSIDNVVDVPFQATDGFPLNGKLFLPKGEPTHHVMIGGAVAVPQKVYRHIARYLASRGAAVFTYDYRSIGASPAKDLKTLDAPIQYWATRDFAAAIDWMDDRFPGKSLKLVCHSFGGQALGLSDRNDRFSKAVMVAVLAGYWGNFDWPESWRIYLAMQIVAPLAARWHGYLPGNISGFGEDIAWSTFGKWVEWCKMPDYFFDDPTIPEIRHFRDFKGDILSIRLTDDKWGTRKAVARLVDRFPNATLTKREITPASIGVNKIGHFGFFRPDHRETLWADAADWLFAD